MNRLKGLHTALITPFNSDGSFDEKGFRKLVQLQLDTGVDGIVLIGTTGESPTLSDEERTKILCIGRDLIQKPILMIAGTGSNSTAETIKLTQEAERLGADMALIVVPYYNKPSQEGLFRHFEAVAQSTTLPILLYNVPGRCGQNLSTETVRRLFSIKNIIGIKEASGNIAQITEIIAAVKELRPDFSVMSGDDALTLPLMALGGQGIISVLSNALPNEMKLLVELLEERDFDSANTIHDRLMSMFKAEFIESNPAPIKAAMEMLGLPAGPCRLPLAPLSEENSKLVREAISCFITPL